MKGIILAGGAGTRLAPLTNIVSKQLLPVYDKPMINYPLSILMLAGIRDILIISTPHDLPTIETFLGNGSQLGLTINYKVQPEPKGIAQAFIIGKEFIGTDNVALILGDNIFYGHGLSDILVRSAQLNEGGKIFVYQVQDPQRYGVAQFNSKLDVISIEEKPLVPKSNFAVTGLYFYDNDVVEIAESITPSNRGELEITDVNKVYLMENKLKVEVLGRGFSWLDAGTHDSLLEASNFISILQKRQNILIGCIEEIAWRMHFIDDSQLSTLASKMEKTIPGQYLFSVLKTEVDKSTLQSM